MTLDGLIQSTFTEPPTAALLEKTAVELNIPIESLLDAFVLEVAEGYISGKYAWDFVDVAMNNLYTCAYALSDLCLPDFAYQVFIAFDEGEYIHEDSVPGSDGEPRTKMLLAALMEKHSA